MGDTDLRCVVWQQGTTIYADPLMPVLFAVSSASQPYYLHIIKKVQGVHVFCIRKFKPNFHAPLILSEV